MTTCSECGIETATTNIEWTPEKGWAGTCKDCRLVPVTDGARFVFVRVGGQ